MEQFANLLRLSLRSPGRAGRVIVDLGISRPVLAQMLALVVTLSVLLTALLQGAMPALPTAEAGFVITPFAYALILAVSLLLLVGGIQAVGRAFGGTGRFDQALALIIWLEVLAMGLRLVQGVLFFVLPPLAGIVGLLGLGYLGWCLLHFVDALHGFKSLGRAALVLVLALVGIGITLAIVLTLTGFGVQGGTPNV